VVAAKIMPKTEQNDKEWTVINQLSSFALFIRLLLPGVFQHPCQQNVLGQLLWKERFGESYGDTYGSVQPSCFASCFF
jgi:hypothetical protein